MQADLDFYMDYADSLTSHGEPYRPLDTGNTFGKMLKDNHNSFAQHNRSRALENKVRSPGGEGAAAQNLQMMKYELGGNSMGSRLIPPNFERYIESAGNVTAQGAADEISWVDELEGNFSLQLDDHTGGVASQIMNANMFNSRNPAPNLNRNLLYPSNYSNFQRDNDQLTDEIANSYRIMANSNQNSGMTGVKHHHKYRLPPIGYSSRRHIPVMQLRTSRESRNGLHMKSTPRRLDPMLQFRSNGPIRTDIFEDEADYNKFFERSKREGFLDGLTQNLEPKGGPLSFETETYGYY